MPVRAQGAGNERLLEERRNFDRYASRSVVAREGYSSSGPRVSAPATIPPLRLTDMDAARRKPAPIPDHETQQNADAVDVSVFAPSQVTPGSNFMVQVLLHLSEELENATARAALIDDAAVLRGNTMLDLLLPRGSRAMLMLSEPSLTIPQPASSIMWRGKLGAANFVVKAPVCADTDLFPVLTVSVDGAPAGEIRFKLAIRETGSDSRNALQPASSRRYRRAFFSYSSHDRVKVLEIAQACRLLGIEVFQDVLALEPGMRWENGLYREIDRCDLFLLFWSDAARQSEWVAKEVRYALERRDCSDDQSPNLVPLILEGPPPPEPPEFLRHLHFNDWMRFAIAAERAARSPAPDMVLK